MTKTFIAGHRGMVGGAICRQLQTRGDTELITKPRAELDLLDQSAVFDFFKKERPNDVILAGAKVGGIYANNTYPADFIYENLQIQNNVIHAAHQSDVQKLLFLGSSCIYPKAAAHPISEAALLTGALEPTNEPYAIAKIAGIKMCESYNRQYGRDYRAVMPANLYGPGDNYHPENSHVVPALIRRFHEAKHHKLPQVTVWGTGTPRREFLYVEDMAQASLYIHNLPREVYHTHTSAMMSHINVGSGCDMTIKELAQMISAIVGFEGRISFDRSKQDGVQRKCLNVNLLQQMGWQAQTDMQTGLRKTYNDFLNNIDDHIRGDARA